MKLNIGSSHPKGKYRGKEWTNIDVGHFGGDNFIMMDATRMYESWTEVFEEIHAVHVLEHINRNKKELFVSECFRVLKSGGVCYIEVPDFIAEIEELIRSHYVGDEEQRHKMTTSIFGKQRYEGDQHCWGFTISTLKKLMEDAGFKHVEIFDSYSCAKEQMISAHYRQEPVLLARGVKP